MTTAQSSPQISIDWLRLTGPKENLHAAVEELAKYFGNPTFGKGRYFLNHGYHYGSAAIYFDHDNETPKEHTVVDIPGAALNELNHRQHITLARSLLMHGFRATRCDIAVDFFATPNLIRTIVDSCKAGQLCRARVYTPQEQVSINTRNAYGCNIGRRGKHGSGRYLRVYDKGLETGTKPEGQWVRWEAELSSDPANEALKAITTADNTKAVALSHCFGVCDFRENNGERHLERRPRCKWFQDILDDIEPARTTEKREQSTLHTFKRWMQNAVLPKLTTLSAATDTRMDVLLQILFEEHSPDPEHLEDPKVRSLCIELDTNPSHALKKLNNKRLVFVALEEGAA